MLEDVTFLGIFAVAIGAVLGALSRYYVTEYSKKIMGTDFPYGTFIVNFTGCLLMGFTFTFFKGIKGFPLEIDLLVITGFLGSYTTFSSYGYDTFTLWSNHKPRATMFYWLGSTVLGVIGIIIGRYLANLLVA